VRILRIVRRSSSLAGSARPVTRRAFSLLELLVVIGLIGLLAAIGMPALKGIGQGNAMNAAVRQVLDDLALARLTALNSRSRVSVVFLPPMLDPAVINNYTGFDNASNTLVNIYDGQCAAYAIITERTVGDQPGQSRPRYVRGEWRRLPEGILFAPWSFISPPPDNTTLDDRYFPFTWRPELPFPTSDGPSAVGGGPIAPLCLVFSPTGQLITDSTREPFRTHPDRVLTLVPGSVLVARVSDPGAPNYGMPISADLPPLERQENRAYEETRILVSGLTGRASAEPVLISQ